jgi:sulfotransferase
MRLHFISGLPRSGSTLLAAILRQNPGLASNITSPVGALFAAMLREMSALNESSVMIGEAQRAALLRGLFSAYYEEEAPAVTIFDTNRAWCARLHQLSALFPDCRVICCVRHVPWIVDSFERLHRENRWQLSRIFDFEAGGTVYARADGLAAGNGLVGFAFNALKQAVHSDERARIMLLSFETLVRAPEHAMRAVYDFVGLPHFAHDFENVAFDAAEFDARLGAPGLHRVRPRVAEADRRSILPPELWSRFERDSFWLDPAFKETGVMVI